MTGAIVTAAITLSLLAVVYVLRQTVGDAMDEWRSRR